MIISTYFPTGITQEEKNETKNKLISVGWIEISKSTRISKVNDISTDISGMAFEWKSHLEPIIPEGITYTVVQP